MHIEAITQLNRFQDLRAEWRDIYRLDPGSHIFLSHEWLETWFALGAEEWMILAAAAERGGRHLGFLPLRRRRQGPDAGSPSVISAGTPFADFTGFICRPEADTAVASAFGAALARIGRERIDLTNLLLADRRIAHLVAAASREGARCISRAFPGNGDGVDQSIAPYVVLPSAWEDYTTNVMSSNSRQKARRFLRKLDQGQDLFVTHTTAHSLKRDVTILMRLWLATFADRKGEGARRIATVTGRRLAAFHRAGLIDICVLWRGGTPIAAHALYLDQVKRSVHFAVGACDKSVHSPPPSFLLHCYGIRRAIAQNFQVYDFLRGNEAYKYSFADRERHLRNVTLQPRSDALSKRVPSAIHAAAQ